MIGFWDGALPAYCLCVYARWVFLEKGGGFRVEVQLIFAKSRISPATGITAPRAELQSLTALTRAILLILRALDHKVRWVVLMGDSKCCIAATKKPATEMKQYFQNRISEFHTNMEMIALHAEQVVGPLYVPGHLNPADLGTRPGASREALEREPVRAGLDDR